jgi:hypothetical protein
MVVVVVGVINIQIIQPSLTEEGSLTVARLTLRGNEVQVLEY